MIIPVQDTPPVILAATTRHSIRCAEQECFMRQYDAPLGETNSMMVSGEIGGKMMTVMMVDDVLKVYIISVLSAWTTGDD